MATPFPLSLSWPLSGAEVTGGDCTDLWIWRQGSHLPFHWWCYGLILIVLVTAVVAGCVKAILLRQRIYISLAVRANPLAKRVNQVVHKQGPRLHLTTMAFARRSRERKMYYLNAGHRNIYIRDGKATTILQGDGSCFMEDFFSEVQEYDIQKTTYSSFLPMVWWEHRSIRAAFLVGVWSSCLTSKLRRKMLLILFRRWVENAARRAIRRWLPTLYQDTFRIFPTILRCFCRDSKSIIAHASFINFATIDPEFILLSQYPLIWKKL